jgi:hypothetical protein
MVVDELQLQSSVVDSYQPALLRKAATRHMVIEQLRCILSKLRCVGSRKQPLNFEDLYQKNYLIFENIYPMLKCQLLEYIGLKYIPLPFKNLTYSFLWDGQ